MVISPDATRGPGFINMTTSVQGNPQILQQLQQLLEQVGSTIPPDLGQQLGDEMGRIVARNIDAGGRPPYKESWRARLTGGTTLKESGKLYAAFNTTTGESIFRVEGNNVVRGANPLSEGRTFPHSDAGVPYANVLLNGGFIWPRNKPRLRFPAAEDGRTIKMPIGQPVFIPPRNFLTVPDEEAMRLTDIVLNYIEGKKMQMGFKQGSV